MQLGSASHIVIGATDPGATRDFFRAFGFVVDDVRHGSLVRGLGQRTELEIVEASPGVRLADYDLGPRGLDLYTSDMDRSLEVAASTSADVGPVGVVEIGPMVMKQVTVWGPDGLPVVLIENSSRRGSLLDDSPDELHSEVHSIVWAVADRDAEAEWWDSMGATRGMDLAFSNPAVASFMRLPDEEVELSMVMFANEANDPIRFELLDFTGRDGAPFIADQAGIQAVGFTAPDAEPGRITTPGGVVLDIRAG